MYLFSTAEGAFLVSYMEFLMNPIQNFAVKALRKCADAVEKPPTFRAVRHKLADFIDAEPRSLPSADA